MVGSGQLVAAPSEPGGSALCVMKKIASATRLGAPRLQLSGHRATRATLMVAAALAASACESYVPAKPGTYRERGEPVAEAVCGYETPTASRFLQMRCRSAEDLNRTAAEARDTVDSIRSQVPDIK